jgi:lysophospholipase L1-like esterase
MKMIARVMVLTGLLSFAGTGYSQAAATAAPTAADQAKQIAALEAKLADWPQLQKYEAANAALAPAGADQQRVVFYGDSITEFWGKNGTSFFPGTAYINRGISGQTTPQMLVRFRQDVIDLHPRVVVILGGTNDVAGNTGPMTQEMTEENWASMADLAKANGIRVIFGSVPPAKEFSWRKQLKPADKIRVLNAWLKDYCASHSLTYLDYYSALTTDEGGMKPDLSGDGVHPNAKGYEVMTPLAQAAIDKTLAN